MTASEAKTVYRRKGSDFTRVVRDHLYSQFTGNAATQYGKRMEKKAIAAFEEAFAPLKVEPCGLIIHPNQSWLAASADGLILTAHSHKLPIEHICRKKSLLEAMKSSAFCLCLTNGKYFLKARHQYCYQMQIQLACTQAE